jgi:hypothetical protein
MIVLSLPYHPSIQHHTAQARVGQAMAAAKETDSGNNQSRYALNSHAQLTVKLRICMFRICAVIVSFFVVSILGRFSSIGMLIFAEGFVVDVDKVVDMEAIRGMAQEAYIVFYALQC